ncbi:MAG: Gfo/Idh/MocA family oxidoreductase [Ruminococcaceae bacterium]|nr:Gfo/Idh/MocA family oxidoreductase [Oscillospiraceae bacterium]
MSKVKVMLAGIGGYGATYLDPMLKKADNGEISIEGLVDPFPQACKYLDQINERGIKIYASLEEFYAEKSCDLAIISTPIQFHTKQTLTALSHGSNVLCEKPMTGDLRDVEALIEAREKAGKFIMIGYQWSHSKAILDMKRDVLSGIYGKPTFFKTLILWPRNKAYFNRGSGWAGKIKAADGTLIYDSVANNAAAHYLHNIFFTMGDALDAAETPIETKAQLYRANPIENFDTSLISCKFKSGAESLYIASHSTDITLNPVFEYRFEKGVISFDENDSAGRCIVGRLADGTERRYGDPFSDQTNKLNIAIANVNADVPFIPCGVETATAQVRCIAECAKQPIINFEDEKKRLGNGELTYIDGLYEVLVDCYKTERML